jgi:hypothetical protein
VPDGGTEAQAGPSRAARLPVSGNRINRIENRIDVVDSCNSGIPCLWD